MLTVRVYHGTHSSGHHVSTHAKWNLTGFPLIGLGCFSLEAIRYGCCRNVAQGQREGEASTLVLLARCPIMQ